MYAGRGPEKKSVVIQDGRMERPELRRDKCYTFILKNISFFLYDLSSHIWLDAAEMRHIRDACRSTHKNNPLPAIAA